MSVHGSSLALGTVQWGLAYGVSNQTGQPSVGEIGRMLEAAREAGVTVLDTAAGYGSSERVIGDLTGGDPHWMVVTKLASDLGDEEQPTAEASDRQVKAAVASIERSLHLLRRKTLPVLLLHRLAHRRLAGGRVWAALQEERERGRIGALGVSAASPEEALQLVDDPDIDAIQVAASLADQRLLGAGFYERARARGVQLFVRSVFLQGALLLEPRQLPGYLRALTPFVAALASQASALEAPPESVLFAHARSLGGSVLVGCENESQLQRNLAAWRRSAEMDDPGDAFKGLSDQLDRTVLEPSRWPAA